MMEIHLTTRGKIIEKLDRLTVYERRIVEMIIERILAGQKAYGPWNADDPRDMAHEALEECLDAAVYSAAGLIKQAASSGKDGNDGI